MNKCIVKFLYIIFVMCFCIHPVIALQEVEQIEAQTVLPPLSDEEQALLDAEKPIEIPNPFEKKSKKEIPPPTPLTTEISLSSDEIFYNNDTNEVEVTGNVVILAKPEKSKITAKRGVYSRATNTIKLFDDVTLYKDGGKIKGDYMIVDLKRENILMNEPVGDYTTFKITGREGYAYANKIESINGELQLAQKMDVVVSSHGFGSFYDNDIIQKNLATDEIKKKRSEKFKIYTHEIVIKSDKDHDEITFKDADLFYKKLKLATAANIQIFSDKEQNYIETNVPEIGSLGDFGSYIGLGYVTKIPFGATLKVVPSVVVDGNVGIGAIARLRSKRNFTEAAWATSSNNLVLRGKYKFNDNFWADYSRHGYIDEWFYGQRRPGYLAQLVYNKSWNVPDLNSKFTHRFTGGYVSEYARDADEQNEMPGTMRLRYQAELTRKIYERGDREQDVWMCLDAFTRAGATVYGTGDTHGFFSVGPMLSSRVNRWGSRIALSWAGIGGKSPYLFDDYRYGRVSLFVDENFRINKYLALGYQGTFSPLKDNYEDRLITENKFYVMAGPEDVKVAFSYDTIREIAAFDLMLILGSDKFKTRYDKLTIENMKTLGKKRDKFEDLKFYKLKVPEEQL